MAQVSIRRHLIAAALVAALGGCITLNDNPSSLQTLRSQASAGDANSQYALGLRYLNGYGVPEDHTIAADWFKQSAGQGNPDAAYMLGIAYYTGRGIARNASYAVAWFEAAAEKGHIHARYQLGDAYANGRGVNKEPAWAARWFESAARSGHAGAQFSMGVLYASGLGLPENQAAAWAWISLAEGAGFAQAREVRIKIEEGLRAGSRTRAERMAHHFQVLPPETADKRAKAAFVQNALGRLGYEPGPADGMWGPRSSAALAAFRGTVGSGNSGPLTDADIDKIRRNMSQSL